MRWFRRRPEIDPTKYVTVEALSHVVAESEAIEWQRRVLADALLRMEAVLVEQFGQPSDDSVLSIAHRGIRIAFRTPGAFYDFLQENPELKAVLDSNPIPPLEWEQEAAAMREP